MLILVISYPVSDKYQQGIVRIFFMKKTSVTIFMPFEALEGDLHRNVAHIQVHLTGPYSSNAHPPKAFSLYLVTARRKHVMESGCRSRL
jgi:hypothetical protein